MGDGPKGDELEIITGDTYYKTFKRSVDIDNLKFDRLMKYTKHH